MKNLFIIAVAILTLSSCTQQKIAFVDSSELMKEYTVMKTFEEGVKAKEAIFTAKYQQMQGKIEAEYQDFMAKAAKMNQKKAAARNQEISQKYQQMQQMQQQEAYQIQQESQAKATEILKEVTDFVKDYGKKNQYTFILGASEGSGSVLYGKEALDITTVVVTALNAKDEKTTEAPAETKEEVKIAEPKTAEPKEEVKEETEKK